MTTTQVSLDVSKICWVFFFLERRRQTGIRSNNPDPSNLSGAQWSTLPSILCHYNDMLLDRALHY